MNKNVANNVANEKVQDYVKKSHITTQNELKSEKTAQDVQKKCLSLTEQWKNGELPDGFYYFKMPDGAIEIASEYRLIRYKLTKDSDKIEVLAEVPSYTELQSMNEAVNQAMVANIKLVEQNKQLKELLKECREVAEFAKTIVNKHKWFNEVITKIDEVLK